MKTECMRPALKDDRFELRGEVVRMAKQVAYGEATVRAADGSRSSAGPRGPFSFIAPTPTPPDPYACRPRARGVPRAAAGPRAPARPCVLRLPLGRPPARSPPGARLPRAAVPAARPLSTVLMGTGVTRQRGTPPLRSHGAALFDGFLGAHARCLAGAGAARWHSRSRCPRRPARAARRSMGWRDWHSPSAPGLPAPTGRPHLLAVPGRR